MYACDTYFGYLWLEFGVFVHSTEKHNIINIIEKMLQDTRISAHDRVKHVKHVSLCSSKSVNSKIPKATAPILHLPSLAKARPTSP